MHLQMNVALLYTVIIALGCVLAVYIENNAYKGVTIAFSPAIQEEEIDLEKLKNVIQKSSELLYRATRKRAFFSEVDLLYPSTWSSGCEENATTWKVSQPQEIFVYVTDSKNNDDSETTLRAQHSKGCGERGEIIYMSSAWLNGNEEELSREFVRQWAIYRYGVFEEEREPGDWSCFTKDGMHWIQNGCYTIDVNVDLTLDSNGIPSCDHKNISDYFDIKSSLMSTDPFTNVTEFCDGSELLPHNPLAPTRHNRICRGQPVWTVIKASPDFRYGRNLPRGLDDIPRVSFSCSQETTNHIIFAIQTNSEGNVKNVQNIIADLRLSLLRFLVFDALREIQVSIITFHEKAESPIHLNLTNSIKVYEDLNTNVRPIGIVKDVCLSCGLQSAFDLSAASENKSTAVVFVVFASALKRHNLGDFIYLMESSPSRTHLIIIQDIQEDFSRTNLVETTCRTGGKVFMIPSSRALMVTKLTMYLSSVVRNPLSIQDNLAIIHQTTFSNISGTVTDVVEADVYLEGEMTYTVICDSDDRLTPSDPETKCQPLPGMKHMEAKISCCFIATLEKEKVSRKWTFSFHDEGGTFPLTCSSLATVRLRTNTNDFLTVRGWLNTDKVESDLSGHEALIVYAEIMRSSTPVTNAVIHAAVYSSSNPTPTIIQLLDSGNGDPDMNKEDGIYSRYFTRIYNRGVHSVIMHAEVNLTNHGPSKFSQNDVKFSRIVPLGSFLVVKQPINIDYYPPNRIGDLRVTSIDHNNSMVTLQWTAPGDNYDDGIAKSYNVKFSQTRSDLDEATFEIGSSESLSNVGKDISILPSGNLQIHIIQLPQARQNTPYYIAIKTMNKNNDTSTVSNIVQVLFTETVPVQITNEPDVSQGLSEYTSTISDRNISEPGNSTKTTVEEQTSQTVNVPNSSSSIPTEPTTNNSVTTVEPLIHICTTEAPTAVRNNDSCNKEYIITLASAVVAGIVLLVLVVNAIICICFKKHKQPKKLSKKASLRPPHNITVVPRETPAAMNDYTFSAADGNCFGDSQDFEVDSDYTFVSGSQRLKSKNHSYHMTPTMTQTDVHWSKKHLAGRYSIPENSITGSVPGASATAEVQRKTHDGADDTEAYAIPLGIV